MLELYGFCTKPSAQKMNLDPWNSNFDRDFFVNKVQSLYKSNKLNTDRKV